MSAKNNPSPESTADREILVSRVFDAPRELVWRAMTDSTQVVKWWGPRGFTTTIKKMEVKPGGTWEHTMHGPDGTNYPNKSIFKEVVAPECLVFAQGGTREGGGLDVNFIATWSFDQLGGSQTRVTIHMVFPTPAARDLVVKEFGALEGAKETLARLSEHLPVMAAAPRAFTVTRTFDAPRDLVWRVWTEREHLMRWFGPKGFTTVVAALEARPGGMFHYAMRTPDGHEMWGKWIFKELFRPEKMVVIVSFSDAKAGITRHPMSPHWPLETISTTTLTERDGKTTVTLNWAPYNATDAERQIFDSSHESMKQGWGGTMEQLTAYLAEIQKGE